MKRIAIVLAATVIASTSVTAQTLTLTNNFGGDADNMSKDLIIIDKDGNTEGTIISDRTQLDYSSEMIDGRIRYDWGGSKVDGKEISTRLRGYIRFRPIEQLGFAIGNDFFTKYITKGAYLNATDDTPTIGKLASNGFAVIFDSNGFKAAANIGSKSTYANLSDNIENLKLNLGVEYTFAEILTTGATIQELLNSENFSAGAFVSYTGTENLSLNASFAYRASDDYLDSQIRTGISACYEFADAGITLAADFLTGLNDKDAKGDTSTTGIPYYTCALISYSVSEPLQIVLTANIKGTFSNDKIETQIYPYFEYKTKSLGTYHAGIKLNYTKEGYNGISLPIFWQYKLKK